MRVTAYSILLFYLCLNVSLYVVNVFQVIPTEGVPSQRVIEQGAQGNVAQLLLGGFLTFTLAALITYIGGSLILGGTAALILFALQYLVGGDSVLHWIFFGFPAFVGDVASSFGMDAGSVLVFQSVVLTLGCIPWFWFILSYFGGRSERS